MHVDFGFETLDLKFCELKFVRADGADLLAGGRAASCRKSARASSNILASSGRPYVSVCDLEVRGDREGLRLFERPSEPQSSEVRTPDLDLSLKAPGV